MSKKGTIKPSVLSFVIPELVAVSQPFEVKVVMNTINNPVNAAGIYIRYDHTKMQLLDLDTKESFCQFYPEKKFDNNQGLISLACGAPHPGYRGENLLMKLTFMPLVIGTSQIQTAAHSQLLVSDGKGTNALKEYPSGTVHVVARL